MVGVKIGHLKLELMQSRRNAMIDMNLITTMNNTIVTLQSSDLLPLESSMEMTP
jgi:hypothetical protein